MLEYVSAKEYARRHSVSPCTVGAWARGGRLPAIRTNAGWQIDPAAEPPRKIAKKAGVHADGDMNCQTCKRARRVAYFSPSGLARGRCRDCANYMEVKRHHPTRPDVISYSIDLAVWIEMQYAPPEVRALRRERIKHHTERIAALGLAGDGKDWHDNTETQQ